MTWPGWSPAPAASQPGRVSTHSQRSDGRMWLYTGAVYKHAGIYENNIKIKSVSTFRLHSLKKQNKTTHFKSCFGLDTTVVHQLIRFVPAETENHLVQRHNTFCRATNGLTAWKSNQHLHRLPLQPKNISAGFTSTQGAINYLTSGLPDPCMSHTGWSN